MPPSNLAYRRSKESVHSTWDELPLLTVIIPVYNEAATLKTILDRVRRAPYSKQVIFVDDGSTDESAKILAELERPPRVEVLFHERNRGKGMAIRTALEHAVGKFTIIQDADLEYDPANYADLIEPLRTGNADATYGSRYLNNLTYFPNRRLSDLGVKLLNTAVQLLYGVRLTDEATCYKAFSTSTLREMRLKCERFEFCPEVTAKACRMGLRIQETPISYSPRGIDEGKKIRLKDGWGALATLWAYRNWSASCAQSMIVGLDFAAKDTEE